MKYEHTYGHFNIPAPVIKDSHGAIEDAAGELTVTHQLVSSLIGDIEGMQDIARQQRDQPGTIDPQAVNMRLEALSALASAIDGRMKDAIILLYAIVDKENNASRQAA